MGNWQDPKKVENSVRFYVHLDVTRREFDGALGTSLAERETASLIVSAATMSDALEAMNAHLQVMRVKLDESLNSE